MCRYADGVVFGVRSCIQAVYDGLTYTAAMQFRAGIVIAVCALGFALCLAIGFTVSHRAVGADAMSLALAPCVTLDDSSRSDACIKKAVHTLLAHTPAATLMSFIVASTSPKSVVADCHVIAHAIGQESLARTGSLEPALAACTNACSYGCVHGAIAAQVMDEFGEAYPGEDIEHAGTAEIEALGKKYCDRDPILCHGIGHIARIAADSVEDALATCTTIATADRADSCFRGVFMEDVGTIAFTHSATSGPVSLDYGYPCSALPSRFSRSCYMQLEDYQIRIFDALAVHDVDRFGISRGVCEALRGAARDDCFFGLGYKLDRNVNVDGKLQHKGAIFCGTLSAHDTHSCITGLAYNYASFSRYGDFIKLCDSETNTGMKHDCYVSGFYSMPIGSAEMSKQCALAGSADCEDTLSDLGIPQ